MLSLLGILLVALGGLIGGFFSINFILVLTVIAGLVVLYCWIKYHEEIAALLSFLVTIYASIFVGIMWLVAFFVRSDGSFYKAVFDWMLR